MLALLAIGRPADGEGRRMQKAMHATTGRVGLGRLQSLPTMPITALLCLASPVFSALLVVGRLGRLRLDRRHGRLASPSR